MGLFDEVHYDGKVYQTKDFDCLMMRFYIEDGRLLKSIGKTSIVQKKDRPYPKAKEGTIQALCGSMKYTETAREDTKFHGVLDMYDSDRYLKLKFTDGVLANIEDATVTMRWNEMPEKVKRKSKK